MNKKRKRILALAASLIFLGHLSYGYKNTSRYEITDSAHSLAFAKYSKGLVYIGSKTFLATIIPQKNDVLVLDSRDEKDPDMKIFSSYKIVDPMIKDEILKILLQYEKKYPSKWNRTIESMRLEWYIHNIMHFFNYEIDRTTDVDFNNDDENTYNIMKKLTI